MLLGIRSGGLVLCMDLARELAAEVQDEPRPEEPEEERADEDSVSSRMTPRPAEDQDELVAETRGGVQCSVATRPGLCVYKQRPGTIERPNAFE